MAVLLLGLGSAALTLWNLSQSRLHMQRFSVSHALYEAYLSLESHTYQLFKQYGDAIIIGDTNQRAGKVSLIKSIGSDIRNIRNLIREEGRLREPNNRLEAETLTEIEQAVERLIVRLDQFSPTGTGEFASDWGRLSELLNEEIDGNFRTLLQSALNEEQRETASLQLEIEADFLRQRNLTALFALLTALVVVGIVAILHFRITRPIDRLASVVRQFSEGDFSSRVQLIGNDELADIGHTIDTMADKVAEQTDRLAGEKQKLQRAVVDRTKQLSIMLEDIKRTDASRKKMIADVSHELRTPLTIIRGEADIALRGADKPTALYRDALERTREAARHTSRLVDDLLFVARTEAGEIRLRLAKVDLAVVVRDALKAFGRQVTFQANLPTAPLHGDAGRIRQALLVLLENARHHGGDEIVVTLTEGNDQYQISVADSGPGMSEEEKAHAFERFYRGTNAAERYREGAGLGLPVALSIAEAHGGSIALTDRDGGGLVASIAFPISSALEVVA